MHKVRQRKRQRSPGIIQISHGPMSKLKLLYSFLERKVLVKKQSAGKAVRDSHAKKGNTSNHIIFLRSWNCFSKASVTSFLLPSDLISNTPLYFAHRQRSEAWTFLRYTCGRTKKMSLMSLKYFHICKNGKSLHFRMLLQIFMIKKTLAQIQGYAHQISRGKQVKHRGSEAEKGALPFLYCSI